MVTNMENTALKEALGPPVPKGWATTPHRAGHVGKRQVRQEWKERGDGLAWPCCGLCSESGQGRAGQPGQA